MKNVTKFIALGFTCVFAACTPEKTVETTEETTVIKEVEVVRVETPAPEKASENSTEVSFGKDGVKLETKDGGSGTKIEVKGGGSAKVEVKGE